jgi:hypothetical protein
MKITFDDGESFECSPEDTRQVSIARVFFSPNANIPKHLERVWADPPTYAPRSNAPTSLPTSMS